MHENNTNDRTVRETATVTVSEAVDGRKKRRKPTGYQRKAITTTLSFKDVLPEIMAAAQAVRKPSQIIVIDSPTQVRVVNR